MTSEPPERRACRINVEEERRMPAPSGPGMTRRQRLADLLSFEARTFDGLLAELRLRADELEVDLRRLDRTLRSQGKRLHAEPARCQGCGFVFKDREARRFAPPGRCPGCRDPDIRPGRIRIG